MKTERYIDLCKLYMIPSYKDSTGIKKLMVQMIPDYEWKTDKSGNLYGSHPDSTSGIVLSSHLDMVKTGKDIANVINVNGVLFGIDEKNNFTSLGADDKNGLWCLIQASKHKSKPHIVLFEKEEIGRIGSLNCNIRWFDDKDCCIVVDRKGSKEIIIDGMRGQYSSMLGACFKSVNPDWHYEKGMGCDADSIKDVIDCINISCGYYNAHTSEEFTVVDDLEETVTALNNFLDRDWSGMPWQAIKEQHEYRFGSRQNVCTGNTTNELNEDGIDYHQNYNLSLDLDD